jgi:ATP-dependent protease ClpP protease subunit
MKSFIIGIMALLSLQANAARLDVVGYPIPFESERIAILDSDVDPMSAFKFALDMLVTNWRTGPRIIVIDSSGGLTEAGNNIIHSIEMERAYGVRVICFVPQKAHSMGFNILTHCDLRLADPRARMLVHKVERVFPPVQEQRRTARNLRAIADNLDKTDEPYRQANAKAMHLSLADYDNYADNETWWTAQRLLDMKYLHGFATFTK